MAIAETWRSERPLAPSPERPWPLSGAAAVTLALACDMVGLWPTVREAWRAPALESPAAWSADAVGNLLCLLAVAEVSYAAVVYPAYLFAGTALVAVIVIARRRHVGVQLESTEEPTAAGR